MPLIIRAGDIALAFDVVSTLPIISEIDAEVTMIKCQRKIETPFHYGDKH